MGVTSNRFSRLLQTGSLFRAIFTKQVILLLRYPLNTIASLIMMYGLFALVFFGGQAIDSQAIADNLEGLIIIFFLWMMAWSAFIDLTWDVTREAQWGTLEQLYMSVFSFEVVLSFKAVVNVLLSFIKGGLMLIAMMLTARVFVTIDLLTVVPIALLGLTTVVGVGFVFTGLAIIYKRLENVFQILGFVLVFLIAAPVDSYPVLGLLPLSQSGYLLLLAMEDGVRIWEFAPSDLLLLIVTAVGYLAVGLLTLRIAQRRARRLGVMDHY